MNQNQPTPFPFQITNEFSIPSKKINADGSFFFLLRPNFNVKQRAKDLIPLFHLYFNGSSNLAPGYILELPPCLISTKSATDSKTISFAVIRQNQQNNSENSLWDLKKSYFFYPDKPTMITIFLDLTQNVIEANDHLIINGKNLQVFHMMWNPINTDVKTRHLCYWLMPPVQKQQFWFDKLLKWKTITNEIANHQENFLSNVGYVLGHVEIPSHSPQSGLLVQKEIRNDCGYLLWISGSCLSGSCYLYLCDVMKKKLIHSQFSTIWNTNETAEFIVYLPVGQVEQVIEFGVLCADSDKNIVFVIHEFCILQLTENLYGNFWELPYQVKQDYDENFTNSKYGVVWYSHKEKF